MKTNFSVIQRLASAALLGLAVSSQAMAAKDEAAAAKLPDAVRAGGKLNVTISLAYPPMEYNDAGSTDLKGFDIDLAKAIAERLGLAADFQNVDFPQLIPQVVTGRSDLIMTAFSDKVERQTQLDFIDYFQTGNVFYTATELKDSVKTEADLCGKTIAVATGTSWVTWAEDLSKTTCAADKQMNVIQIPTQAEHIMQIKQGRAQASIIGLEGLLDLMKQEPGKFYQIGAVGEINHYGIAFAKQNAQLRDAVLAALNGLKADGTYVEILDRYGLKEAGVEEFTVNGAKK
ncbi:putative glutamine transporter subunit; periplasmic binding component of ABC superfamily [Mesorhizobium plurifarium]|uniref:Putative glutamine transporter subunit periplasmic binding component of ABC superfamily n=1 Tax=Mesorhizobium plurifarium TaxID=69974 RepID=A0A090D9P0_MESPL|nr:putative glutamine transporter subunit; periplasmic binding component of ABC superfamily [Mesorhizobium plurifarium]